MLGRVVVVGQYLLEPAPYSCQPRSDEVGWLMVVYNVHKINRHHHDEGQRTEEQATAII
jgi:hypothetical protein